LETVETTTPECTIFDSAVDRWVVVVIGTTPAVALVAGGYAWWIGQADGAAILFGCGAVSTLVMLLFVFPCRYTLLPDAVSIRCGLILHQVPLSEIVSAEPTASLRSGPALSLKRIAIRTKKKTHIISPKDREGFLAELKRRCIAAADA
jgi:membrane protein YdbS with pleckstrin-like domain